jgi:hypothetical protein
MRFDLVFLLALAIPAIATDWVLWSYNDVSGDWCAGEARFTVGDYPRESHCYPIEEGFGMAIAGEFDESARLTAYTGDYCSGEVLEGIPPRKCFSPGNGVLMRSYSISR